MPMIPFEKTIYVTRPLFPNLDLYKAKLEQIWDSKWLSNMGPQHAHLEELLRHYLGVANISLFSNGTIALMTAIRALELSGDIVTTPFTFAATPHSAYWGGLTPVFADINGKSMCLDPERVEAAITPRTSAILAVHVFGNPCDVDSLADIAKRRGLRLIYDAAHAFGCKIGGRGIGTFGDITMFSFHPTKLFHTAEGGALTYSDASLKERIVKLRNFGIENEDEVSFPGYNGKMNELSAAMGQLVLEMVPGEMKKRAALMAAYREGLSNIAGVSHTDEQEGITNSYQYFCIRIDAQEFGKDRNYVHKRMKDFNVLTRKYFFPLCSEYPGYREHESARSQNLPVATNVVSETLAMPFYGELSVLDIERICEILKHIKNEKPIY